MVDSDRTGRDDHAHIGHSSGRAIFFELGVLMGFSARKFRFFGYNVDLLETGGDRLIFGDLNESSNRKVLYNDVFPDMLYPLSSMTH